MRLIVFFDLPVETAQQRRAYRQFRKYLTHNGYLMMQESVYAKLAIDGRMAKTLIARLAENRPPQGLVQVLQVTEKQFAEMVSIVGMERNEDAVTNSDTLVVL